MWYCALDMEGRVSRLLTRSRVRLVVPLAVLLLVLALVTPVLRSFLATLTLGVLFGSLVLLASLAALAIASAEAARADRPRWLFVQQQLWLVAVSLVVFLAALLLVVAVLGGTGAAQLTVVTLLGVWYFSLVWCIRRRAVADRVLPRASGRPVEPAG